MRLLRQKYFKQMSLRLLKSKRFRLMLSICSLDYAMLIQTTLAYCMACQCHDSNLLLRFAMLATNLRPYRQIRLQATGIHYLFKDKFLWRELVINNASGNLLYYSQWLPNHLLRYPLCCHY